jgi:hypothetical protein
MEKNWKAEEWTEKEGKSTYRGSDWSETPSPFDLANALLRFPPCFLRVCFSPLPFLWGKRVSQQIINCKLTVYSRTPGIIFFWNRRIQIAFGCECAGGWVNYCGISDMEHSIHHSSEPNSWTPILLVSTPDLPFFQNSNTPFHSRDICF